MSSTFSGFYVAKSGIQAARANLQVTGQNMTNVNTTGYTRQRVDSYSIAPVGSGMRYASADLEIGGGVNCSGVSQIRDPYLDIRYRSEHAKTGKTGTQLDTLSDIEDIFDESTKDGLSAQFSDLVTQLNSLASSPSDFNLENIVKNSSLLLTKAFNNASQQLSKIRSQQTKSLQNDAITKANNLLKNIAHLNEEIKSSEISGTSALELTDQRNTMIDELSQYANIEVSSKSVDVGSGRSVSELQIDLVSGDQKFSLVSNNQYSQFSMTADEDTGYVTMALNDGDGNAVQAMDADGHAVTDIDGNPVTLTNADLTEGMFGGYLSMLNEKGEFDSATAERGIGYYETVLDKLANDFANTMNTINSTNAGGDNKPLFTTADGETTGITAGNISIADAWNSATSSYITATKQTSTGVDTSKLGDNVLYMVTQLAKDKTYTTNDDNVGGTTLFTTSIESFVSDVSVSVLALQVKDITRQDSTYNSTLNEIDTQRTSISAVDVNEEGINLIMYNQALTASSRFMTTLDEALDTIINKMGIVGR
ncbi:flagellar hook-associated protein FlgK [Caproiciproducens faecalis]|uniref:Flagellar hook-associated protein 1 n=1 Tax=Caproiciproducens faecalis TaxID=2820301 RepID=A0ABS7DPZ2_9FIRM|nr:flagellar hook-associated protein FlgK [Caproiciproducens faecalis]MBW7573342.1 flagellar hook-associated protein FlgK [Caproiciproducens faecalis]